MDKREVRRAAIVALAAAAFGVGASACGGSSCKPAASATPVASSGCEEKAEKEPRGGGDGHCGGH